MKNLSLQVITMAISCLSTGIFAQNSRTVEVTVSDTVFLKTSKITYHLVLDTMMAIYEYEESHYDYSDDYESEYYNQYDFEQEISNTKRRKKGKKVEVEIVNEFEAPVIIEEEIVIEKSVSTYSYLTKKDLMNMLDSMKIDFDIFDNSNYEIGGELIPLTFMLNLKNELDLKRVQETFTGRMEIRGSVKDLEYESVESKMSILYKDLYAKAQKEALILAKLSGLTLDKIHKIYEQKSEFDNYMDDYKEVMKNLNLGTKEPMDFSGHSVIIERVFVFDVK